MSESDTPRPNLDPMGKPDTALWRIRWFQVTLGLLVLLAVASYVVPAVFRLLYATRSVLVPVLIGLALAYVMNPVVTALDQKWRVPRPVSAVGILVAFFGSVLGLSAWIIPKVVVQTTQLVKNLPGYLHTIADYLGVDISTLEQRAHGALASVTGHATADSGTDLTTTLQNVDMHSVGRALLSALDIGAGAVTGTVGVIGYVAMASIIIVFCFFFIVWKWDAFLRWFEPYLPASQKEQLLDLARKMDASVSAFIRGRLIQAVLLAAVLSVGFTLVGVPSGLLLGLIGGALNLIPYAGIVVWPIAVGLAVVDQFHGGALTATGATTGQVAQAVTEAGKDVVAVPFSWLWAVILPSVVYILGQSLDAYVVEPVVQGKATNLDALTVLLVVLIGGSLAGLLGLLIAIPTAACIKILFRELIGPKLREIASHA